MALTSSFRPLTRIHLLLTFLEYHCFAEYEWFPTSDEDSSTPDLAIPTIRVFRHWFPTSDEDSSTPDNVQPGTMTVVISLFPTSDEDSSTPDQ